MSKIEEMAKEYCQGSSFDDACMMKPAYIAGANAVLREIEKVMTYEHYNQYRRTHYAPDENKFFRFEVRHKIQELKGK